MVARGARGLGSPGPGEPGKLLEDGGVGGWRVILLPQIGGKEKRKKKITQKTLLFNNKLFIFIEKESKKVKSKNLKIQCTKPNFLSTRHISPEPEAGCPGCHGFI